MQIRKIGFVLCLLLYFRTAEGAAQVVRVGQGGAKPAAILGGSVTVTAAPAFVSFRLVSQGCGRQFQWGWGDHYVDGAQPALQAESLWLFLQRRCGAYWRLLPRSTSPLQRYWARCLPDRRRHTPHLPTAIRLAAPACSYIASFL